jgi:hypothetical protein
VPLPTTKLISDYQEVQTFLANQRDVKVNEFTRDALINLLGDLRKYIDIIRGHSKMAEEKERSQYSQDAMEAYGVNEEEEKKEGPRPPKLKPLRSTFQSVLHSMWKGVSLNLNLLTDEDLQSIAKNHFQYLNELLGK